MAEGTTTGINAVSSEAKTNANWYDPNGRRLAGKPAAKGVLIQNGKKIIVK